MCLGLDYPAEQVGNALRNDVWQETLEYWIRSERVIAAGVQGVFAAATPGGRIQWYCPPERAVIRPDEVHVSRRLKGYLRRERFRITFNSAFDQVIDGCADRQRTWITLI